MRLSLGVALSVAVSLSLVVSVGSSSAQTVRATGGAFFDAESLPAPPEAAPALGWRYGALSNRQTRALRRGFKLPLDALAGASSVEDLAARAVITPLPDPARPLLPVAVDPDAPGRNPFAGDATVSFRDDPMRALGFMLGAADLEESAEAADATGLADSPFDDLDAVESTAADAAGAEAEVSADGDDPFGDDADPFGGDDPFGDF